LDTAPSAVEAAPATPVRVPVTVLNGTDVTGLAARVSDQIGGGGWETVEPGTYEGDDIASSTVYFAQGDEKQRQAAVQLVDQFPQLEGPVVRFFDLPEGVEAPGLVVVTAGDWKP
jgi:hypothetical protein